MISAVHGSDANVALRLNGAPFATANFDPPSKVLRLSNAVGRSLYAECGSVNGAIYEIILSRSRARSRRARRGGDLSAETLGLLSLMRRGCKDCAFERILQRGAIFHGQTAIDDAVGP